MYKILSNILYMLHQIYRICPDQIWLTLLSGISSIVRSVSSIYATKYTLDALTYNYPFNQVTDILLLVMVIQIIGSIFETYFISVISKKNEQLINLELQELLYEKASVIELSKYDDPGFYDIYNLALQNAGSRAFSVLTTFASFLSSILNILTLTTIITQLQPFLFPIIFLEVILVTLVKFRIASISYKFNKSTIPYKKQLNYVNRVYYQNEYSLDLRMFNIKESLTKLFKSTSDSIINITEYFGKQLSVLYAIQSSTQLIFYTLLSLIIAKRIFNFQLSIGDYAVLTQCSTRLMTNLTNLLNTIPNFYEHSLYINSFREFVEYSPNITCIGEIDKISFNEISLSHISFKYTNSQNYILNNLNMHIKAGEKIAIVGLNGSGKSTLIKLILGLYSPNDGQLIINNEPYYSYNKKALSNLFGVVFQHSVVYQLSIAENVLMRPVYNPKIDEPIIINALKQVGLYDKIKHFPKGIYTNLLKEIDGNGAIFSGGELQKIAIARTLARNASFIILDEPSNALDPISENELFDFFFNLPNKTVIIISHHLSLTTQADKIYVLEKGQIVEEGTHMQLMQHNCKYAKMFLNQTKNTYIAN